MWSSLSRASKSTNVSGTMPSWSHSSKVLYIPLTLPYRIRSRWVAGNRFDDSRSTWLDKIPLIGRLFGAPQASLPVAAPEPEQPPVSADDDADASGVGTKAKGKKKKDGSAKQRVVSIGGERSKVDGKVIKCDLCAALPFEACVYNCPTSAIHRRRPETLFLDPRDRNQVLG